MDGNELTQLHSELTSALDLAQKSDPVLSKQAEDCIYEQLVAYIKKSLLMNIDDNANGQTALECYRLIYQTIRALCLNPAHTFDSRSIILICQEKTFFLDLHDYFASTEDPITIHQMIHGIPGLNDAERTARHLVFLSPTSAQAIDPDTMAMFFFTEETSLLSFPALMGLIEYNNLLGSGVEKFHKALSHQKAYTYRGIKAKSAPFSHNFVFAPWMRVSYWTDKEASQRVRHYINSMIHDYVNDTCPPQPITHTPGKRNRPKLLIAAEFLYVEHVMFRCIATQVVKTLEDFEVVFATGEKTASCKGFLDIFGHSKIIDLKADGSISNIVNVLQAEEADILWYPSIGMSEWTATLCNIRLAPIQIACFGMPDTTYSKEIDFVICDHHLVSDDHTFNEAYYSEKLIQVKSKHGLTTPMCPFPIQYPSPAIRPTLGKEVHIGINAFRIKLNNEYIDFLQRVEHKSQINITWHFFPNLQNFAHRNTERHLSSRLKNVICHTQSDYPDYISNLHKCDFMIGSFPFTGTNTTVDAFQLGIPVLSKVGKICYERADYMLHVTMGTAEACCAETEEALMALILTMINDDEHRAKVSEQCANNTHLLFEETSACGALSKAMLWAIDQYPFEHVPHTTLFEHD